MIIYVGDTNDIIKRIRTNHCSGNVEGSVLRKHVAHAMGHGVKSRKRPSGSTKVQIDLPNSRTGETHVSNYIHSGKWRYVICNSYEEAHDFQWYVIEQLKPLLNKNYQPWNRNNLQRYQPLLIQLMNSPALGCTQLLGMQSGPGVYALYNQREPRNWQTSKDDNYYSLLE